MITSTSSTNRGLAESAINDLYRIVKRREPAAILWCDSPFQMQVIPYMVHKAVQSLQFAELFKKVRSGSCSDSSAQWDKWLKKNNALICEIAAQSFQSNGAYEALEPAVKVAAIERLREHLQEILIKGKLEPVNVESASQMGSNLNASIADSQIDLEFVNHLLALSSYVERCAGLKFTLNPISVSSVFIGFWDPRFVTQFVPGLEKWLAPIRHSDEVLAVAKEVKDKCADMERIAQQLFMWFIGLLPHPAPTTFFLPEIARVPELLVAMAGTLARLTQSVENNQTGGRALNSTTLTNHFTIWLPCAANWLPFALACRFIEPKFFGKLDEEIDIWAYLSHAAIGYLFCSNICFACSKPTSFQTNAIGRPHNETGPVTTWKDGLKIYAWRGVVVSPELIENKESITLRRISSESNAELRRVMMDIYGEARYLMDSGAIVLDESEQGILYRLDIPDDEPLVMVRVRNSTPEVDGTFRVYFLRVPPEMRRVKQAIAWTFGLEEHEYSPDRAS